MPARRIPNSATGYCNRFGAMIATRSPGPSPGSDCRYAAKSRERRSHSAKVIVPPRLWNAGLAPNFATIASSSAGSEPCWSGSMSAGMPAG